MFLLDTNVISELRVGKANPSADVRRWAAEIPGNQLYLSAVSILELETGVRLLERNDDHRGQILRSWMESLMREFSSRVLTFGSATALLCAALHIPDRRPDRDAMIAATAREHAYTIVTRNTADFAGCDVQLLNPWLTP